jgi:hypothetical protein
MNLSYILGDGAVIHVRTMEALHRLHLIIQDSWSDITENPYQQRFNQQREGNAMDWQYATYGTFAFMVETDTTCNPKIELLPNAISNQLNGLFWLMRRSFGSGIAITSGTFLPIRQL